MFFFLVICRNLNHNQLQGCIFQPIVSRNYKYSVSLSDGSFSFAGARDISFDSLTGDLPQSFIGLSSLNFFYERLCFYIF